MTGTLRIVASSTLLAAAILVSQSTPGIERPGPQADGSTLLVSGWRLRPAGRQVPLDTFPMSSVLTPDGRHLVVLNGGYNPPSIIVLDAKSEKEISRVPVADAWLGLALTPNGRTLYVGGGSQAAVFEFALSAEGVLTPGRRFDVVPAAERTHRNFIGDIAVSDRLIYAADLFQDQVVVINPSSGRVIDRFKTGRRPYRILFHPDGKSYFVTGWAAGSLYHHETANGNLLATLRLGPQPMDMVWSDRKPKVDDDEESRKADIAWDARIFVAAANTNRVFVVGVTVSKELRLVETINVAMTPRQPLGMTPSALALSPDQTRLYVVCSDANAVAVADITGPRVRTAGFVPSGWYPLAARALPDGRLVILNGRDPRNPKGQGTASFVDPITEEQLDRYSLTVFQNSPYRDELLDNIAIPRDNPVPPAPIEKSPIRYVIYVVKEDRTSDQVPGEDVTPNHHKLAREFVLFDNFHVSGDDPNWSTAAIAPAYVQRMWPNSYAGRRRHYDYEGGEPAAVPPAGYLWTNAAQAGVTMRNYGFLATNTKGAAPTGEVRIEADVNRARIVLDDLKQWEAAGEMPRLLIIRMGSGHTSGTSPNKIAPRSAAADNDYALGMLVEAFSKSRFWPQMAIFVEPAFVLSPYTRTGATDSTMYNTTSMLRTMELILGLNPMTHFDAAARPMFAAFTAKPDPRPYVAEKPLSR